MNLTSKKEKAAVQAEQEQLYDPFGNQQKKQAPDPDAPDDSGAGLKKGGS